MRSGDMTWNPQDWIALAAPYAAAAAGALASFIGFLIAAWIVHKAIMRIARRDPARRDILHLLASATKVGIIGFGLVISLDTLGVAVSALIAGLGLTGFALGFALKDIVQSMVAGIMIMMNRPFQPGDYITVAGFHGIVEDVALRYTKLIDGEKRHLVPNGTVVTSPVTVEPPPRPAQQQAAQAAE